MKAVIWTKYGGPEGLIFRELETPVPGPDEILIRIHATSVTAGDCEMRRLGLPLSLSLPVRLYAGLLKPKRIPILGQEFSGEIVEVGEQVNNFKKGQRVFGTTGFGFGAYAEYICVPAEPDDAQGVLALIPPKVSYEDAATLPTAGLEALHYLRGASIQPGDKVLIIGGGGSIGTFAIQLAKLFSAEVTGVDSSKKQEMMQSLGADHVIDYTNETYLNTMESYDLVIDLVGRHSILRRLKLLKPEGIYFLAFAKLRHVLLGLLLSLASKKKLRIQSAAQKKEDLNYLAELLRTEKLRTVIDRSFSLEQTANAHEFAQAGGKIGNVSIMVNNLSN